MADLPTKKEVSTWGWERQVTSPPKMEGFLVGYIYIDLDLDIDIDIDIDVCSTCFEGFGPT